MKNITSRLFLAIYLILAGITGLGVSLGAAGIIVPIFALIAGILMLMGK